VLLPWLPTLIATLRAGGAEQAPLLIREAGRIFPGRLAALDSWTPPWLAEPEPAAGLPSAGASAAGRAALLAAHPATCDALAGLLGCDGAWAAPEPAAPGAALLARHPETAAALAELPAG
jgi:hypothetical protein